LHRITTYNNNNLQWRCSSTGYTHTHTHTHNKNTYIFRPTWVVSYERTTNELNTIHQYAAVARHILVILCTYYNARRKLKCKNKSEKQFKRRLDFINYISVRTTHTACALLYTYITVGCDRNIILLCILYTMYYRVSMSAVSPTTIRHLVIK
jgi:hypothetical protein